MMLGYWYLLASIMLGTVGNICLKYSEGYTKPVPTVVNLICVAGSLALLSKAVLTVNLGIAYATWSGVSLVVISVFSYFLFHESLNRQGIGGMILVLAGIVMVNVF